MYCELVGLGAWVIWLRNCHLQSLRTVFTSFHLVFSASFSLLST